jgi:hypothetical protein
MYCLMVGHSKLSRNHSNIHLCCSGHAPIVARFACARTHMVIRVVKTSPETCLVAKHVYPIGVIGNTIEISMNVWNGKLKPYVMLSFRCFSVGKRKSWLIYDLEYTVVPYLDLPMSSTNRNNCRTTEKRSRNYKYTLRIPSEKHMNGNITFRVNRPIVSAKFRQCLHMGFNCGVQRMSLVMLRPHW